MKELLDYIKEELNISINAKNNFVENNIQEIIKIATLFKNTVLNKNKILFFGNGGSAADSQHLAAELVNKLRIIRPALPAIALTTDTSVITSIANDDSYDNIFSRQIEALGVKGDIAFGISTSGNAKNVINAFKTAKKMNLNTIALTGGNGGTVNKEKLSDALLNVDKASSSARIQETHIFIGHIIIELMDIMLKK